MESSWDEDSMQVSVITKPYKGSGTYQLGFDVLDGVSETSDLKLGKHIVNITIDDSKTFSPSANPEFVHYVIFVLIFYLLKIIIALKISVLLGNLCRSFFKKGRRKCD